MAVEVTAKAPKIEKEATIVVDCGENLQDAISRFGEEVVFSNYLANVKISCQSGIRRYLEAGLSQEAIQEKFDGYKPGVTLERVVDPVATLASRFAKMTPEEQAAAFDELKNRLAGGQA